MQRKTELRGKSLVEQDDALRPAPSDRLPGPLVSAIEQLSGISLADVRVVHGSPKARGVGAQAYTDGAEIHVGPGQEAHLAHEAWHVVQQRQGRVKPTAQVGGAAMNDDPGLEADADRMGAKAESMAASGGAAPASAPASAAPAMRPVVQRKLGFEFETDILLRQKQQNQDIDQNGNGGGTVPKGTVLGTKAGLEAQADTNPVSGSMVEFVSQPMNVDKDGKRQLGKSLDALTGWVGKLEAQGKDTFKPLSRVVSGAPKDVVAKPTFRTVRGNPQVSVGLDLSELESVLGCWASGIQNGKSQDPEQRQPVARSMFRGIATAPETYTKILERLRDARFVAGQTPIEGNKAPVDIQDKQAPVERGDGGSASVSPSLRGLVWLIGSYLTTIDNHPDTKSGKPYGNSKEVTTILSRNDFGTLIGMLSEPEKALFREQPQLLVEAVELATQTTLAGLVYPHDFLKGGKGQQKTIAFGLTRAEWVRGIANGKDLLTKAYWQTAVETEEVHVPQQDEPKQHTKKEGGSELHKSLGGYGGRQDSERGYQQAIFEFRKMTAARSAPDFQKDMLQTWDFLERQMKPSKTTK